MLLLTTALVIGFFTVRDYGQSWDEADIYRYGDYAIHAYGYFFHAQDLPAFNTNLNLYGPGFYMLAAIVSPALAAIIPAWSQVDGWHFTYFTTFLISALGIYLLSRRWLGQLASIGVALLFLSQPLFWGHAFINPKDIPFTAAFTASVLTGLAMVDRYLHNSRLSWMLLPAAVLAGLTASFRVIGPLCALIVLGYGAWKLRGRVFWLGVPYLAIAAAVVYLSWPYLWISPIAHYIESIHTMSQFPFATEILFGGQLYKADGLPRSYFPLLLILQLTEPALVLIAAGLVICIWLWRRGQFREPLVLFGAWTLLPAILVIALKSPLYDNGRQLYFLIPPLFILAGVGLEKLFALLTYPPARAALMLLVLAPGILVSIRLHPYEYVYYNSLVGGTGGAFRKYEMDYWGTSLKEMTGYVNEVAPQHSDLLVFGPQQIVAYYLRSDMVASIPGDKNTATYNYAILLTREDLDMRRCRSAQTVHEVGRRGAVFAVLKAIPDGAECK